MLWSATQPTERAVAERSRVADEFRARLRARSVTVHINDSLEELGVILDAVEEFELAVQAHGGDLMVDEPPPGHPPEPDNPDFVLPTRHSGESATWLATRIQQAKHKLQRPRLQH
ncbi:MAG: hypothetical protein ABJC19_08460 [Gemmatimonadota bacterium]